MWFYNNKYKLARNKFSRVYDPFWILAPAIHKYSIYGNLDFIKITNVSMFRVEFINAIIFG